VLLLLSTIAALLFDTVALGGSDCVSWVNASFINSMYIGHSCVTNMSPTLKVTLYNTRNIVMNCVADTGCFGSNPTASNGSVIGFVVQFAFTVRVRQLQQDMIQAL
jgi:hypothetical protein